MVRAVCACFASALRAGTGYTVIPDSSDRAKPPSLHAQLTTLLYLLPLMSVDNKASFSAVQMSYYNALSSDNSTLTLLVIEVFFCY